jgi:hypothetical protein
MDYRTASLVKTSAYAVFRMFYPFHAGNWADGSIASRFVVGVCRDLLVGILTGTWHVF